MSTAHAPTRLVSSKETVTAAFSPVVLNIGFLAALALAVLCFVTASIYLFQYLHSTEAFVTELAGGRLNSAPPELVDLLIHARIIAARFSLLSCGILAGLSLALLGFCLFLVGAKGEVGAEASAQNAKLTISKAAPGVVIMIIAILLIGFCVTTKIDFEADIPVNRPSSGSTHDYPNPHTDKKP